VSDKTLLDLFVLLGFSDESHLLRLTAREVHIKEEPSADKCIFLYNEQEAGPLDKKPKASPPPPQKKRYGAKTAAFGHDPSL